jgi:glycosyltransferase involved in cell wall biosynthesis
MARPDAIVAVEVFADVSQLPPSAARVLELLQAWESPESLGVIAAGLSAVVSEAPTSFSRSDWYIDSGMPLSALERAMDRARESRRPLLVLLDAIVPPGEAVSTLVRALDEDPLFGAASARVTSADGRSLGALHDPVPAPPLPRHVLGRVPDRYIVSEVVSSCFLLRWEVLANMDSVDARFQSSRGALWHYLARARRTGFRTVVCNRAVVRLASGAEPRALTEGVLPPADTSRLHAAYPELRRARHDFGPAAHADNERVLATADDASAKTLLLDARNMTATFNGTVFATLGVADGLHATASDWQVTLMASAEASRFHGLEERYPHWNVCTHWPERHYRTAVRLSQPWHLSEMVDLHRLALFSAYLVLDSISWDIVYVAPPSLDGTWRFLAEHADALLFISEFSRRRFLTRFPKARATPSLAVPLSCDPGDYARSAAAPEASAPPYLLVVGNHLAHKHVQPTLDLLTTAFPYVDIVAVGTAKSPSPRVRVFPSGQLPEQEVQRLYAESECVVFPSFYEGFGFPVLQGLSHNRTVFARASDLLTEVAALCSTGGQLVAYQSPAELVDLIGRFRHGQTLPTIPLGTALAPGARWGWGEVATRILAFIADVARTPLPPRRSEREEAIAQMHAYTAAADGA